MGKPGVLQTSFSAVNFFVDQGLVMARLFQMIQTCSKKSVLFRYLFKFELIRGALLMPDRDATYEGQAPLLSRFHS